MKDKLLGILLVILAIVTLPWLEGDGTFLVFSIILATILFLQDFVAKTRSIMKKHQIIFRR